MREPGANDELLSLIIVSTINNSTPKHGASTTNASIVKSNLSGLWEPCSSASTSFAWDYNSCSHVAFCLLKHEFLGERLTTVKELIILAAMFNKKVYATIKNRQ